MEKGRFIGIEREGRICNLCSSAEIDHEYHYIFECHFLKAERKKIFRYNSIKELNTQKIHDFYLNISEYNIILCIA